MIMMDYDSVSSHYLHKKHFVKEPYLQTIFQKRISFK